MRYPNILDPLTCLQKVVLGTEGPIEDISSREHASTGQIDGWVSYMKNDGAPEREESIM